MKRLEVDPKTVLQFGFGLLIAFLSGSLGYRFGVLSILNGRLKAPEIMANDISQNKECGDDDREEPHSDRNLAGDIVHSDYRALIEKNHLEERDSKISAVFHGSEVGHAIGRVLTLLEFGPSENTPEGKIVSEDMKLIEESQPEETFNRIQKGINGLGVEFVSEQQFLIQLVGKLVDLPRQQKIDFLIGELNRNHGGVDSKYYKFNRVVALSTMMQLDMSPTVIENAIRDAFVGNSDHTVPDRGTRILLLNIYEVRYPDEGRRLRNEFGL